MYSPLFIFVVSISQLIDYAGGPPPSGPGAGPPGMPARGPPVSIFIDCIPRYQRYHTFY